MIERTNAISLLTGVKHGSPKVSFSRTRLRSRPVGQYAAFPDWPQWHGPDRTNISKESGLLKQWPSGGPKLCGAREVSAMAMDRFPSRETESSCRARKVGRALFLRLDRASGKPVWKSPLGRAVDQDRGGGPRGTPTTDGDSVYALSENGDLACIRSKDGSTAWKRNILTDFGGRNPYWLISESPLIDGARIIVTPGGRGAGIVALDKTSGKEIWRASQLSDPAAYASCVIANVHDVPTIMNLTSEAGVGVRATDGKLMWRYEKAANGTANCSTPVYHEGKVFYTFGLRNWMRTTRVDTVER